MIFPGPGHDHSECTAELLARAERICKLHGGRLTGQRRDILCCVAQYHSASGAYDIIDRMAEHGPRPAPITIYRALDFLTNQGLVHKIESRNAFVACMRPHEGRQMALLVCEICGTVAELDAEATCTELKDAALMQDFYVNRAMIELTGLCGACKLC